MTTDFDRAIEAAADLIAGANHLVVFTGAGVSTESGLPDYRGPDGVWTRRDKGLPPPRGKRIADVAPNAAHRAFVELQELGKLGFLISQNVDDLHLRSGIRPELLAELHGNVMRVRCRKCEQTYPKRSAPAACTCGHTGFKSSVINFGDNLPQADLQAGFDQSSQADVYLVVGSTLLVTPAADMPRAALERGASLIIVNLGETPLDDDAAVRITGKAGEVLTRLLTGVRARLARA